MPKKLSAKKSAVSVPPQYAMPEPVPAKSTPNRWPFIIGILVVVFVILLAANKGWVLAAVVNGKPIFSWDLNNTLRARYGQQTLEGMIGESLISDEASKNGITVNDADLAAKQKQVLSSLGTDVSLDDFLKFQGMTKADFQHQLKIQITVEKLLTKGLTISDDDINNYIATNRATLTASDPAQLKAEARQAIVNNLVSDKLQTWFTQLRQKAAVIKFL